MVETVSCRIRLEMRFRSRAAGSVDWLGPSFKTTYFTAMLQGGEPLKTRDTLNLKSFRDPTIQTDNQNMKTESRTFTEGPQGRMQNKIPRTLKLT